MRWYPLPSYPTEDERFLIMATSRDSQGHIPISDSAPTALAPRPPTAGIPHSRRTLTPDVPGVSSHLLFRRILSSALATEWPLCMSRFVSQQSASSRSSMQSSTSHIWSVTYYIFYSRRCSVHILCVQDEPFHIPQAQAYCRGEYLTWDPKITTPPGL